MIYRIIFFLALLFYFLEINAQDYSIVNGIYSRRNSWLGSDTTIAPVWLNEVRFRQADASWYYCISLNALVKRWDKLAGGGSGDIVNGGQNGAITIGTNNNTAFSLRQNNIVRMNFQNAAVHWELNRADGSLIERANFSSGSNFFQLGGTLAGATNSNYWGLSPGSPASVGASISARVHPLTKTSTLDILSMDTAMNMTFKWANGQTGAQIGYTSRYGTNTIFPLVSIYDLGYTAGIYVMNNLTTRFHSDSTYFNKPIISVDTARFAGRVIQNLLTVNRIPFTGANKVTSDDAGLTYDATNDNITSRYVANAGTAAANTAPFKYTSGVNLTTPENGAKEYDGSNEFLTASSVRYTIAKTLTTTSVLDFPDTMANESSDLTVSLTGAALGDVVSLGIPHSSVPITGSFMGWVSSANTITVRYINNDGVTNHDPGSGTFRISLTKY